MNLDLKHRKENSMKKLLLLALTAMCKKLKGKTLFNGNTYYWGKGTKKYGKDY